MVDAERCVIDVQTAMAAKIADVPTTTASPPRSA
jgi:hypothetical protein